jgi:isocitrate/isopropylmalate dehydrogenase
MEKQYKPWKRLSRSHCKLRICRCGGYAFVQWPNSYDVLITENLFGDILNEASVISGSMGLMPSASVGEHTSLYEPIHGSYPQATGLNIANPLATILSAAMMFEDALDYMKRLLQ